MIATSTIFKYISYTFHTYVHPGQNNQQVQSQFWISYYLKFTIHVNDVKEIVDDYIA